MFLDKKEVEKLFESETHQRDVIDKMYEMVIPRWNNVKQVHGWPSVNERTWKILCGYFQEFDRKHHPGVMPGGHWMNTGFSTHYGKDLKDWEVSLEGVKIRYETEERS